MHSDGAVLPDLSETVVLHRLGFVRSDDFPDLAARWLAADLGDSDAVRMLAGHHPNDPWMLEELLATAVAEANIQPPSSPAEVQRIAIDWVTSTWRISGDTRWAVATLARLGETHLEFDLGLFVGLDDEWNGSWGRLEPDLKAAANGELESFTHNPGGNRRRGSMSDDQWTGDQFRALRTSMTKRYAVYGLLLAPIALSVAALAKGVGELGFAQAVWVVLWSGIFGAGLGFIWGWVGAYAGRLGAAAARREDRKRDRFRSGDS